MKKLELLLLIGVLGIFFFASCEKDNEIEIPEGIFLEGELGSIEEYKDYFISMINENNLVVDILDDEYYFKIIFETGDTLPVKKSLISSFNMDRKEWKTTVYYGDKSNQELPALGDSFEINNDDIYLNPYYIAPLTALVKINTKVPGKFTIRLIGQNGSSSDIIQQFDNFGTVHSIPVVGLYAGFENSVEIIFTNTDGKERLKNTLQITTAPVPTAKSDELGVLNVVTNNYTGDDRGKMILLSTNNTIIDIYGNVRWFLTKKTNVSRTFPTKDGEFMCQITRDRIAWDGRIMRISVLGQILKQYEIPSGIHHEIIQKEKNGNFLIGSSVGGTLPENTSADDDTEDLILEIDKESGAIVKQWNMRDYFDHERPRFSTEQANDWFHLNSVEYLPHDNSLLISSKLQCMAAKIGYDDGAVKWILGSHIKWKEEYQGYLLTPVNFNVAKDPNEDFTFHQHTARLTPDGNIVIYDNGKGRPGYTNGFVRAVEYRIDEVGMKVEKVWEHVTFGTDVYSGAHGSTERYENGNTLIGHASITGGQTMAIEVDQQGTTVFQINLSSGFYRANKVDLYKFAQ